MVPERIEKSTLLLSRVQFSLNQNVKKLLNSFLIYEQPNTAYATVGVKEKNDPIKFMTVRVRSIEK